MNTGIKSHSVFIYNMASPPPPPRKKKPSDGDPGGGGGTQIWFRRGCAAEAAKPAPICHFGGKGYPLLGVWRKRVPIIRGFSRENDVFVYFSDEMGENI